MGVSHGGKYSRRSSGYAKRKRTSSVVSKAAIMYKRPTARVQQSQIAALAKKTASNARKISGLRYKISHQRNVNSSLSTFSTYEAVALAAPSAWRLIFSSEEEAKGAKYTGSSMYYDLIMQPNGCKKRVNITVFFASPKTQKVVVETGGATSQLCSNLVNGLDYEFLNGQAMLNSKRWTTHKMHRMAVMPVVTTEQGAVINTTHVNSTQENRRYGYLKNPVKINNRQALETWKDTADWEINPTQRMHMFIFHDISTAFDTAPRVTLGCVFNGHSSE